MERFSYETSKLSYSRKATETSPQEFLRFMKKKTTTQLKDLHEKNVFLIR